MLCNGKLGIILATEIYEGKAKKFTSESQLPKSSQVVERLSLILPDGKNFKMAFDNWFSSVQHLKNWQQEAY